MKASDALNKARNHQNHIDRLLAPINRRLQKKLKDDSAHIVDQSGDGFCVCYNGSDNACIAFLDIDAALKMPKKELLQLLEAAGI